jgi:hypothetical protein
MSRKLSYCWKKFEKYRHSQLAQQMWAYLTRNENVEAMQEAVERGEAAVEPLCPKLQELFAQKIEDHSGDSDELRTLCLNMSKQIMEQCGYVHSACKFMPNNPFVGSAALFIRSDQNN